LESSARRPSIEWPTIVVAGAIYSAWIATTIAATKLPWWGLLPLGGFLIAWHGSLQHETIHGQPTRSRKFNTLLGSLPIGLWMPYGIYRDLHLVHHRTGALTDPLDDPESFYVTRRDWAKAGAFRRSLLWANTTLVGRLALGPFIGVSRFLVSELRRLFAGDFKYARAWATHLVGVVLVIAWLELVCGLSIGCYLLTFVYPGIALTLLRSFAEHRPEAANDKRVGVVEAGPIASLLYLNNNLHVVHHEEPALPWYALPARYRSMRSEILERNGGYAFSGYGTLFARFGLRPKDAPVHPTR
jgi:fatty acid desaturase